MVEPRKPMAPNSFMISRSNFSWRATISTRGCSFSWQKAWAAATIARSSLVSCSDSKNGSSQLNLAFMVNFLSRLLEVYPSWQIYFKCQLNGGPDGWPQALEPCDESSVGGAWRYVAGVRLSLIGEAMPV